MARPYATNWEHLGAELERVRLRAWQLYLRFKAQEPARFEDHFRGLRVSEAEVEAALAASAAGKSPPTGPILAELEEDVRARVVASLAAGVLLRLEALQSACGLDTLSRDCLLVCLAPEIDPQLSKVFAYLQDDVTKRQPQVRLVLDLLGLEGEARLAARSTFLPEAPLLRQRLVRLSEPQLPLPARGLQIEGRVADYLLGGDSLEDELAPCARLVHGEDRLGELVLPADLEEKLARVESYLAGGGRLPVVLCGPPGTGKKTAAAALCARLKLPLLLCDVAALAAAEDGIKDRVKAVVKAAALLHREALLCGAALYLDGLEALGATEARSALKALLAVVEGLGKPAFAAIDAPELPPWWEAPSLPLSFALPSYGEGARIWHSQLGQRPELALLANKFRLSGGRVRQAIERARGLSILSRTGPAGSGGPDTPGMDEPGIDELHAACRRASGATLGQFARRIEPRYGWDDIVLPEDPKRQLAEICDQLKHRHTVYEEWGFAHTASRGKGLTALFVGESGTGKTMAAEIMAAELALDLYKIDLSGVVSKYIGETEKNLERIFSEAQNSGAILFFDEADAIFGKRSEVKDAHDRYANIEISYLLQRMEDYEGIVILASNLRANMDDAFTRRMQFVVEFPFPEEADRLSIWAKVFPAEAPGADRLDLASLAAQLKLAGGNIRNIAHTAAFHAAANGGRLDMTHVRHAVRREFQKMGRLSVRSDFDGPPAVGGPGGAR